MFKGKWYFLASDSKMTDTVTLALIGGDYKKPSYDKMQLALDISVDELLELLSGCNRRNHTPVPFEVVDNILENDGSIYGSVDVLWPGITNYGLLAMVDKPTGSVSADTMFSNRVIDIKEEGDE